LKLGWLIASQNTAGTEVSRSMRSSTIAWRNSWTPKAGIITVPASRQVGRSWLLQPVTWNNGTETRLRIPPQGMSMMRRQVSTLDRKFSWVVMAPLGKPVVPLV
jgi:hypothetical protein